MKKLFLFPIATLIYVVMSSSVPIYGQCGGIGYTGENDCVTDAVCTYANDYYSQCLPGGSGSGSTVQNAVAKPYTAHCVGSTSVKTTTYKDANGNVTGTVTTGIYGVSGSAGAGWTTSTTTTTTKSYDFTASGNSCVAGTGTCNPNNPCNQ
jgi:hypothetical protein